MKTKFQVDVLEIFTLSSYMNVRYCFLLIALVLDSLSKGVMQQLYSWSYSLRLTMNAVYPQTINKYARGRHERLNEGLDLFSEISEMNHAEELKLIVLEQPNIENKNKEKYKAVYDLLCEWNRW